MSYYIYKICCDDCPDYVYVGSTKSFRQRKSQHKKDCSNENSHKYNRKLYTTIRENGDWDNWRMVIIEDIGEVHFTEARIKEEEHRVKLNANLNSHKCYVDKKEYNKEYREKNKEKIKEHKSQPIICECGRNISLTFKARHERTLIHKELIEEKI
tara:strand:- start:263 stop:727 length:465 start_codon:yes stop_codon:yes gene_type:complete